MALPTVRFGPEEYADTVLFHRGTPAEAGVALQPVDGPFTLIGVHMNDGDGEYMREMVAPTETLCAALRDRLAFLLLMKQRESDPPRSLTAHPQAVTLSDTQVSGLGWQLLLHTQRRVIVAGWDARACVAQLLLHIAAAMPEGRSELHFVYGPLDDAKLDDDRGQVRAIATLMARYAEYLTAARGSVDAVYDGVYLGRHGTGPEQTAMHFHSSTGKFLELQGAACP